MATITGLTAAKMLELSDGWESRFGSIVAGPIANINKDLAENKAILDELNNVILPQLAQDLETNTAVLSTLNDETLPVLQTELFGLDADMSNLNTVVLPGLESELAAAQDSVGQLQGKFPIVGTDISDNAITTPKMTANSINGDRITAGTLNANKIVAGTIYTELMTANTITGDRITANTLNASKIVAGSISSNEMTANTINGDRIAANTLHAGRIIAGSISSNEMTANTINGDRIAANTLHADKIVAATFSGYSFNGVIISGSRITTRDNDGMGWDITDGFVTGTSGQTIAATTSGDLHLARNPFSSYLSLRANGILANPQGGPLLVSTGGSTEILTTGNLEGAKFGYLTLVSTLYSNDIRSRTGNAISFGGVEITNSGGITVNAAGNIHKVDPPSSSLIPNVRWASGANGGNLQYTSHNNSSIRYKKNLLELSMDTSVKEVLSVPVYSYDWREDAPGYSPGMPRQVGFIAEELVEAGFDKWVGFNEEGQPDEVDYSKWTTLLHLVAQEQERRITSLEAKLAALSN